MARRLNLFSIRYLIYRKDWLLNIRFYRITSHSLCVKSVGKISGDYLELWEKVNVITATAMVT